MNHITSQAMLFGGVPPVLYNVSVLAYLQAVSFPDLLNRLATDLPTTFLCFSVIVFSVFILIFSILC